MLEEPPCILGLTLRETYPRAVGIMVTTFELVLDFAILLLLLLVVFETIILILNEKCR